MNDTNRIIRIFNLVIIVSVVILAETHASRNKRYIGSESCVECHKEHFLGWESTLHSRQEQMVIKSGPNRNVLGDFTSNDSDLTFTLDQVDMLIGSRFKQRYAKKIGDDYYILPAQWKVESGEWHSYNPEKDWWTREDLYPKEWNKRPASKLCEGCHTTGFNIETKQPAERNIGCEACHGPGNLHTVSQAKNDIVNPASLSHELGNMVCFQCHMSGRPPQGKFRDFAWPVGYRPGDDLQKVWRYTMPTGKSTYELWAGGHSRKNRVQGNTFIQSSKYRKGIRCFTCHDSHGSRYTAFTVKSGSSNGLCLTCHGENTPHSVFKKSITEHTRHKAGGKGSICIECHMPKTGKNATRWDARNHSFKFISPQHTIRYGTPNGCNNCHKNQTPKWALKVLKEGKK